MTNINLDRILRDHMNCEFSTATQHFRCCPTYETLDESDCLCDIGHDLNPSIHLLVNPIGIFADWEKELME